MFKTAVVMAMPLFYASFTTPEVTTSLKRPIPMHPPAIAARDREAYAHTTTRTSNQMTKRTTSGLWVLGRHEWIRLGAAKALFSAYVDPQSSNSRLGVKEIKLFERNGKEWVQYQFQGEVYKYIVTAWTKPARKPIVKLRTRLGELNEEIRFVLVDGGQGIVLGENFMRDIAVQNASYDYIQGRIK